MIGKAEAERNRDTPTKRSCWQDVEARRPPPVRELLAGPGGAAPVVVSAADYRGRAATGARDYGGTDPSRPDATDV